MKKYEKAYKLVETVACIVGIVAWVFMVFALIAWTFLQLWTTPVQASEPLNVTNVHYTADNGLQSGNTFTLREGYRERIYYQIEYTGDGNPADLMLMWNDYQGIEITVQQYTQGSGVMLVRYNEAFSGWGVTGFWVQGGNGNGKRMLRFRSQPNTPVIEQPETTTEQPTTPVAPEPTPQPEAEEQVNEDTTGIENGISEQQQPEQHEQNGSTADGTQTNEPVNTPRPDRTEVTSDGITRHSTPVIVEEKTPEKTVESTEKQQEAPSDDLTETKEESTFTASKHSDSKPEPKKNVKDNKGKVLTIVIVSGIILGSLVIQITERTGKRK